MRPVCPLGFRMPGLSSQTAGRVTGYTDRHSVLNGEPVLWRMTRQDQQAGRRPSHKPLSDLTDRGLCESPQLSRLARPCCMLIYDQLYRPCGSSGQTFGTDLWHAGDIEEPTIYVQLVQPMLQPCSHRSSSGYAVYLLGRKPTYRYLTYPFYGCYKTIT